MRLLSLLIIFLTLGASSALAQVNSNSFGIRVDGGDDLESPSTPVLLTATPIASTQINISWSVATDNVLVSGYSVSRDGLLIATTTSLSYSDTGLSASTTYSYTVRAFDPSLNYSSSSNDLATTTLQPPPPPATTTSEAGESTAARVVIDELQVKAGLSTTSINITTARPARFEIRWGRTDSYELGYMVSSVYSVDHALLLTDLEPGTRYKYEIIGYTQHGVQSLVRSGSFTTDSVQMSPAPANINRFEAVAEELDVVLSWQLPAMDSFSHVRIVRSHLGFPEHPYDGAVVYQGEGVSAVDANVFAQFSPVYYTAFVYDSFGNISSGAVAVAYNDSVSFSDTPQTREVGFIQVPEINTEATSSINTERVSVDMRMPEPSDVVVRQEGRVFTLDDSNIVFSSEREFIISVPYGSVAGNLKSIIVTILDPTDNRKAYAFLLRINNDQTAYVATIAALGVVGQSQIKLDIYDYEAFVVATYQAPLMFRGSESPPSQVVFPDTIYEKSGWVLGLLGMLLLISFVIFFLYKRRDEDKNNERMK